MNLSYKYEYEDNVKHAIAGSRVILLL